MPGACKINVQEHDAFLQSADGCRIVNCRYESLIDDLGRTGREDKIPEGPGPLRDIAAALEFLLAFAMTDGSKKRLTFPTRDC